MSENKNTSLIEVNIENPGRDGVFMPYAKGSEGVPYVVLLDRNGQVLAKLPGYTDQQGVDMTFQQVRLGH